MDDGSIRERVRSQIERDTSDIRTHTFKSQQNTYIHFISLALFSYIYIYIYIYISNDDKRQMKEATLFIQIYMCVYDRVV